MRFEDFINQVTEAVEGQIPEDLKEVITVSHSEVIKTNDELLHGISLSVPGQNCMPTIYLEECFEAHERGMSIEDLAKAIIGISLDACAKVPQLSEISLEYENIKTNLVVQLIDGHMNKERLKTLVHREVGNGFALIAYIMIDNDSEGFMRTAVTKDMAQSYGYDEKNVMDRALRNTINKFQPVFTELSRFNLGRGTMNKCNPLDGDFFIEPGAGMYVLTNEACYDGACALYYPFMAGRIGELLDDDYYVLPSSLHEVIIVPKTMGLTVKEMSKMVREANSTVVDTKDILSYKVLYYNRKQNLLMQPEE